ncbi:MAG: NAD(P)/FAD-dependent oxidoreductase [Lachnospiraceae bacterium]|nr:NAD(P)/FAD-dependent oxidoreductase [Lachnospiraceae bacterium]
MNSVIVIGAGAAGMMAAIAASENGAKVTLLEHNEKTGKKVFITGKGRCNITNACETEKFFDHVISNGKFLYSAFYRLDNQAVIRFFEEAGCKCKEERGERIFPVSDHSSDVIAALNRKMTQNKVDVRLHTKVKELLFEETEERKEVVGVILSSGQKLCADKVIVATGGKSYEATGSTGDGYRFAIDAGHSIKEIKPALVPFTVEETWCMAMQGLALKNVGILLQSGKKKIYEGFGEMLFTHFGVSGPLILSASSHYVKKYLGQPVTLSIDLKPALTKEQLDKRILRDFEKNKNKQFKNSLDGLLPAKMVPVIIKLSGILPEKKVNEITKEERAGLVDLLKNLTMHINGTRDFKEAIITQGGINVKEINPSTMESKIIKNLYFAGEVLDLDAVTGGFNLQIAWSTGYLAGVSAAES